MQYVLYSEILTLTNLTIEEYSTIGASLRYLHEERFQCFQKDFKNDNQLETHIKRNNCLTEIKDKRSFYKFDNILYKKCFCNFYNPEINILLHISNNVKKFGTIPEYITNKKIISNKFLQAHNIIQQYLYELEKIELEKQKQKLKG